MLSHSANGCVNVKIFWASKLGCFWHYSRVLQAEVHWYSSRVASYILFRPAQYFSWWFHHNVRCDICNGVRSPRIYFQYSINAGTADTCCWLNLRVGQHCRASILLSCQSSLARLGFVLRPLPLGARQIPWWSYWEKFLTGDAQAIQLWPSKSSNGSHF